AAASASSRYVITPASQRSAGCAGRRRATASMRPAKLPLTTRSAQIVLEPQALPDLGWHPVARRVGRQGRLGGGVHAPLGRVAILARGGVEVGAARVGDDGDVAVGLASGGDRPVDLTVV